MAEQLQPTPFRNEAAAARYLDDLLGPTHDDMAQQTTLEMRDTQVLPQIGSFDWPFEGSASPELVLSVQTSLQKILLSERSRCV